MAAEANPNEKSFIASFTASVSSLRLPALTSNDINSLEEFAAKVGVPSLANNNNFDKVGAEKRIAIFESLNEEFQLYQESSQSSLEDMLQRYECTSKFYTTNELAKQPALSEKENILKYNGPQKLDRLLS